MRVSELVLFAFSAPAPNKPFLIVSFYSDVKRKEYNLDTSEMKSLLNYTFYLERRRR